jgi:hypothetical protein
MRVQTLTALVGLAVAAVLAAAPVAGRTDCKTNVTAVCIELAGHVDAYRSLLWAICDDDNQTVCKCYDAQQRESGVDWCQWAACACDTTADQSLKSGLCGLSQACTSLAAVNARNLKVQTDAPPAQSAVQAAQVLSGQTVDCSPEVCQRAGAVCGHAANAIEILKDQGKITSAAACTAAAADAAAFGKQLHVSGLTPAVGACACAAVF